MKSCQLITLLFCSFLFSQNVIWENELDIIKTNSSVRCIDLNADEIEDIIFSGGVDGFPTPFGTIAIDGNSGNILWTKENTNEWFISTQSLDCNIDGTPDLLVGGRDAALKVINGINGDDLWSFWNSEDNPNDYGWYNFYNPQIIPDQNNDNFPEILCANGGDHSLDAIETDRPPGHIMILNGLSGEILNYAVVPDSNETYMSPLFVDLAGNNNYKIIFGTGGETIAGNLWIVDFLDLINEDLSNAVELLPNPELGMLAPPSLAKLNDDDILDIVAQNFDGKITAIDGNTLQVMWEVNIAGTESSASPIIGNFTIDDNNPDVFATLYVGTDSSYNDFYQILIDGKTGNIEYMDSIGTYNFATPICFDSNANGKDEVLISTTNSTNGEFAHELILIDFINNTETIIYSTNGGDVWSTPYIKDIDNNNFLDLIFITQKDNPFIPTGVEVRRLETSFENPPFGISWGSYMGTNYDGIFNDSDDCNIDLDLFAFPSVSCPGENSGSINLYMGPNGQGTEPYLYFWSNGETTEDLENIPIGSYSVTVVDANGCQDTISTIVSEYESISFSNPPSCPGGSDGMAYMSSTGCSCNSSNCQFIWTNENGEIIAQGDGSTAAETYKYLNDIPAGVYIATIIHPNGCILEEEIIVPEANSIISETIIEHDCNQMNIGSITINPIDVVNTSCLWSNGQEGFYIENLSPGFYNVDCTSTVPILCVELLEFEILDAELDCNQECNGSATLDDCGFCDSNTENDCILGCNNSLACNYDAIATDDDGSCVFVDGICETCVDGLIVDNDGDNDGVCDADEIAGCTNASACNYDAIATDDDGSCLFVDGICETCVNGLIVDNDLDNDSVCDDIDNCPETYNPNQEDSNDDGIGDACNESELDDKKYSINIFPNPVKNNLNIVINEIKRYNLEIHDLSGKNVCSKDVKSSYYTLNLSNLSSGLYTIKLQSEEFIYIERLIINNY